MPTVVFEPTKDTYISSFVVWRETNFGNLGHLSLSRQSSQFPLGSTRILLQFDLSQIAPGSSISSAVLAVKWIGSLISGTTVSECFKMTYHDWLDSCNFFSTDGQILGENNGWPGTYLDPDTPRNFASNDFDPGTIVTDLALTSIAFPIAEYIPDAISIDSGILSVLLRPATGITTFKNFSSNENVTFEAPKLTITWEPPSFGLTMTDGGNGTCTPDPDQPAYQDGDSVTLTVTPDAGYSFDNWTGDDSGDVTGPDGDGNYAIVMDADKTIQCNFSLDTLRLILNEGSNGTDTLAPGGIVPLHSYGVAESFIGIYAPDVGFQLNDVALISGDGPGPITNQGQVGDGNKRTSSSQPLTQNSEWTSTYKVLWTLTTTIVGGAHGSVVNGGSVLTWPQEPLFAEIFIHQIRILPDIGYQVQVEISAGSIIRVEGSIYDVPAFGFEASDWIFVAPDSDATLTVTWTLIAAGQTGGGIFQKPWENDRGRQIL